MLADLLKKTGAETVSDGVQMYRIGQDSGIAQGDYGQKHRHSGRPGLNIFFCSEGTIRLRCGAGSDLEIGREDILLLSDRAELKSVSVQEPPAGLCMVIVPELCTVFEKIYEALGRGTVTKEHIQRRLEAHGGVLRIRRGCWSRSVFSTLLSLPDREQGTYCMLKAAEMFYLLHARQTMTDMGAEPLPMPAYLVEQLHGVGSYIENHLEEKLTIPLLCRQAQLSATTLKNKFRELYGQPIHQWILCCRLRRASELLEATDLTVLQIAQSVGYDSVSQFNAVFRRAYGVTPSVYRKNVRNERNMAVSVGKKGTSIL